MPKYSRNSGDDYTVPRLPGNANAESEAGTMKTVEFTMTPDGTIRVPTELSASPPAGQRIHVIVAPTLDSGPADVRRKALLESAGAWADDDFIPAIFEEIDRERHADHGREVNPLL